METNLNPTTEAQHDAKQPVMCGFCRDCKYCESDFEFNQLLICKHPKLKLSAVFTYDGCQFGVEEDFGCVQFENRTKLPVMRGAFCWAVTGTFHGSIIEAETEGEARRIFHKHYNGESITHIKKRNVPAWAF